MPIFILTPIDTTNENWVTSTHLGPCVVRAKDCRDALDHAALAFSIAAPLLPGRKIPTLVWEPRFVHCAELVKHDFNEEGDSKVLDPPGNYPTFNE